jgi:flagellin-like protein
MNFNRKKGISEILSAILLIGLTVVGAVFIFIYLYSSQRANQINQFTILVAEIHVGVNSAVFHVQVRNIGTRPIVSLAYNLGFNSNSACAPCSGNLLNVMSGQKLFEDQNISQSYFITWSSTQNPPFTVGEYYVLSIAATYNDGSTSTQLASVVAASA